MGKSLSILLGMVVAIAASGTECITRSAKSLFKEADAVFVGVVVKVEQGVNYEPDRVTFRVDRGFKNARSGELITQNAYLDLYGPVSLGQQHLVFATTGILAYCSRSGPLEPSSTWRARDIQRISDARSLLSSVERWAWWWRRH